jgi:hypothetical protein
VAVLAEDPLEDDPLDGAAVASLVSVAVVSEPELGAIGMTVPLPPDVEPPPPPPLPPSELGPLPAPGSGFPYMSPAGEPAIAVGANASAAIATHTSATAKRGMDESLHCAPSIKSLLNRLKSQPQLNGAS